MSWKLAIEDLECLAEGAAFLGTGGGGDPYIGRLIVRAAIEKHGSPTLLDLDELDDDMTIYSIAGFGAPTVQMEKLVSGEEVMYALDRIERITGRKADAIIPAEVGGGNSMTPIMAATIRGLPIVDADGMGRAFPELQMNTFSASGIRATPLAVVDEHLNCAVVEAQDDRMAEEMTRALAIRMGLRVFIAGFTMTGAEVRRTAIGGTLRIALEIGRTIKAARSHHDPVAAVIDYLRTTDYYRHAYEVFDGKITDLRRDTAEGFSVGYCRLSSLDGRGREAEVTFQNEHLSVRVDGQLRAVVPDLICIVDRETAAPITTQTLRYGQRVKVVAMSAPAQLREERKRHVFGPACFGLDDPFTPVEELNAATEPVG